MGRGALTPDRQLSSEALLGLTVPPHDSSSCGPPGPSPGLETRAHSPQLLPPLPSSPAPLTPKWPFWRHACTLALGGGAGLKVGRQWTESPLLFYWSQAQPSGQHFPLLCPNTERALREGAEGAGRVARSADSHPTPRPALPLTGSLTIFTLASVWPPSEQVFVGVGGAGS